MTAGTWGSRLRILGFVALCAVALLAAGYATQPQPAADSPPGFLWGMCHGLLFVFSLIGSLFNDQAIYALPNSGDWYDLGFLVGATMYFPWSRLRRPRLTHPIDVVPSSGFH